LITQFDTLEEALTRFAVNSVEAALALDFIGSEYRTGNAATTFAEAFMGNSPRLTYNPGSASSSQSTMVNSSGHLVWAPHNLVDYSDGSQAQLAGFDTTDAATPIEGFSNSLYFNGDGTLSLKYFSGIPSGVLLTFSIYVELDNGEEPTFPSQPQAPFAFVIGGQSPSYGSGYTVTNVGGNVYQVSTTMISGSSGSAGIIQHTNQTTPFKVTGWQCYRSDLGGMAPVPGAVGDFQYYVPTNGAAEYLPRVGHHVYNGSTWVNEGLLIESEQRTNLITESTPQSGDLDVSGGSFSYVTCNFTPLSGPGIHFDTPGVSAYAYFMPTYTAADYTFSVFVEMDDGNAPVFGSASQSSSFNDFALVIEAGVPSPNSYNIEHVGGNTYRVSGTYASSSTIARNTGVIKYTNNSNRTFKVTGYQLEQGSTPSSYIPTNGSTVIRGGQSLTVPPAEFGWPEPEVIGPELVTDFSTYADQAAFDVDWTRGTGWTFSGGVASCDGTQVSRSSLYAIPLTVGKVCEFSMEVSSVTAGSVRLRNGIGGSEVYIADQSSAGTYTGIATVVGGVTLVVDADANFVGSIDNISVREINPLSVSIQMDGRMTYADTGSVEMVFWRWYINNSNRMSSDLRASGVLTGQPYFFQTASGIFDDADASIDAYTPGILTPFNISSRHGSTFINGAVDGVALTADTTPAALPDLSNTDLQIAHVFMGTIGQFRQFAGDVGDTGLVTATNPSTEPTLSLTFDGTGGSFYNLSWSE
jgi:hypothetical protein